MISANEVDQMIVAWKAAGLTKPEIIDHTARACLGWPYVFGAWGELCTPSARGRRARSDHPTIKSKCQVLSGKASSCVGCPWGIGVRMYDCRGFTRWLLQQVGLDLEGGGATTQWGTVKNWALRGSKKDLPEGKVACLFQQNGTKMAHTGIVLPDRTVIHCSVGVQTGKFSAKSWTHFAIPAGLYSAEELGTNNERSTGAFARPMLRKRSRGEEVADLQRALIQLGYDVGKTGADGIFGRKTLAAVKAFQKNNGLKDDGIVGPLTYGKLDERGADL